MKHPLKRKTLKPTRVSLSCSRWQGLGHQRVRYYNMHACIILIPPVAASISAATPPLLTPITHHLHHRHALSLQAPCAHLPSCGGTQGFIFPWVGSWTPAVTSFSSHPPHPSSSSSSSSTKIIIITITPFPPTGVALLVPTPQCNKHASMNTHTHIYYYNKTCKQKDVTKWV
jgi:hypothetical protein